MLSVLLPANGLDNVHTKELRSCVCGLLCYIYRHVPEGYEGCVSLRQHHLQQAVLGLLQHLGTAVHLGTAAGSQQYLVPCLFEAISAKMPPVKGDDPARGQGSSDQESASSGDEKLEKRGKLSRRRSLLPTQSQRATSSKQQKQTGDSQSIEKPEVYQLLEKKLQELCLKLQQEPTKETVLSLLEGIRVAVEVSVRCAASRGIVKEWLPASYLQNLCSVWFNTLKQAPALLSKDDLKECYLLVVQSIGAVLSVSDISAFGGENLRLMTMVLSFPWLLEDQNWLDLRVSGWCSAKEAADLCGQFAEAIGAEAESLCVNLLALVPREVAPKWRIHIMKAALNDSSVQVRTSLVRSFPILLHTLGHNSHHLVYDILHPLIRDKVPEVLQAISSTLGQLSCVVAKSTHLSRNNSSDDHLYKVTRLGCSVCQQKGISGPTASGHPVDPSMFLPFTQLLQNKDEAVRTGMVESIPELFSHIRVSADVPASMSLLQNFLSPVEDSSYDVRMGFSKQVGHLARGWLSDSSSPLVAKLKSAYLRANSSSNSIPLQETVVLTIGQLGRIAEGDLFGVVLINLLISLVSLSPVLAALAYSEIHDITKVRKTNLTSLLTKQRPIICKWLSEVLHDSQSSGGSSTCRLKNPAGILSEVASVFGCEDVRKFLLMCLQTLLPQLVHKACPETSAIIRLIAKELEMNRQDLLINNFKYIFRYLACNCKTDEKERALEFVQNETQIELRSLLRSDYQGLHNELLLYISSHYSQVFAGLATVAASTREGKGKGKVPREITTAQEMAEFLQPCLLGILAFFDSQLLTTSIPMEDKKLALESLITLMKLMGPKHITTVRVKVMTTLRICLRFKVKGFPELSCRAWDCFVHSVELSCLGPMLSQIVVTLLPLLQTQAKPVAGIFSFLIQDNREALQDHFHELYFMPELPELSKINAVLKQHIETPSSQSDLKSQLKHSLKGLGHESLDVRLHALSKLKQQLHANQVALHEMVEGSETADPIISHLVSVLLSSCRESDKTARSLVGECLGELGAIDPGRLDLKAHGQKEELSKFQAGVDDINFAHDLIMELARAFLAATDTRSQDCSAFSIQEILQTYECREGTKDTLGRRLWRGFPEHIQEILLPHLHSKYIVFSTATWTNMKKPIYRSNKGSTFQDWVYNWTGYLITKVKQDMASRVFRACSTVTKYNETTALFLLPHVLLHALLDGSTEEKQEACNEILAVLKYAEKMEEKGAQDFSHMAAQTVFSVLDHLTRWCRHRQLTLSVQRDDGKKGNRSSDRVLLRDDSPYNSVQGFLDLIPQDVLAVASFHCRAYTRALMHFESYLSASKPDIEPQLCLLQKLYVAMDEPDGVAGVMAIRKSEPDIKEQILQHESIGELRDASACYERALQTEASTVPHHQGLLRCLLGLGQLTTAMVHVNGVLADKPEWTKDLNAFRVEASWQLGNWDGLENYLKVYNGKSESKGSSNWSVGLGKILLAAKHRDEEDFWHQLQIVRNDQMGPLSAASMESGSYQRGYDYIVRLHMLCELQHGVKVLLRREDAGEQEDGSLDLEARARITQSSFRTREPLYSLRRCIINMAGSPDTVGKELGHCWLQSAKIARKAGHLQTAYSSLLNASTYSLPELLVEKAKWLWHQNDQHQALITLQKGVAEHFSDTAYMNCGSSEAASAKKHTHAKALLLVGRLMEDTAMYDSNQVMKQYKSVVEVYQEWEDGHFYLAKYYDRIMTTMRETPVKAGEIILYVVTYFGRSLQYGNQHIYQSMPRLLALWLDYGAKVSDLEKAGRAERSNMRVLLPKLNEIIANLTRKLAPYQFLTSFSQLISRICHSHAEVLTRLEDIIAMLLVTFPQQCMWLMMAVSKSTSLIRKKRCQDIFKKAKSMNSELNQFIQDATRLADKLLELCNKPVDPGVQHFSLSLHFKSLKRLLEDRKFSPILMPLQSALTVTLPSGPGPHANHEPFPAALVYIAGFEDTVEVLSSAAKPKKIAVRGSDGKAYFLMCKPHDDLRKDCRLMEFNAIVNKCLRKDPESRRRQLYIRTYSVVPLNEECGLIEWVNNTHPLRQVLIKIYKEKGMYTRASEFKPFLSKDLQKEERLHMFQNTILPKHPPVFREWFLKVFPDPTSWYQARLNYCRTTAVMSMVGYILGLGDRHGENILFDSTNGDCVHVDFNCLFNKGETFDWPELVPFRLTHNMVNAMGPLGYEGIFRRACETTMKVMREQKDPLMCVLRSFIFDPLVEWSRVNKSTRSVVPESGEISNEKAMTHVRDIDQRLQGVFKKMRGLPLSIEGHVHHLIQEATSDLLLCQMYIGWASFL
ncbi:serine/threonine-protein kinase ATR-like [Branchiostoma floridae]|uniref:Serine/threonine-protein kinase ATR n=1 Tax=Branchiostoma floridae TaxID=7739 RepID=A0A9J7KIY5_BRAFL|nr:serine/threonine-protein kinase ATR-like [Branchiostoma floridae]